LFKVIVIEFFGASSIHGTISISFIALSLVSPSLISPSLVSLTFVEVDDIDALGSSDFVSS